MIGSLVASVAGAALKDYICTWYANLYMKAIADFQVGTLIAQIFTGNSSYHTMETALVNFITGDIMNAMMAIGMAIATLFFIISLLDLAMTDRFTLEYFIKFLSKFAVSIILIVMCNEITQLLNQFGSVFCGVIGDSFLDASGMNDKIETFGNDLLAALKASKVSWIFLVISGMSSIAIMGIVSTFMTAIVYLVGFTRLFEMVIRGAFMPIAFAMLADDGWRGAGGRYIRKYLAICCQSAVLCMIGGIHSMAFRLVLEDQLTQIQDAAASGSMSGELVMLLGLSFAACSLMFKSIGIINDVFGA